MKHDKKENEPTLKSDPGNTNNTDRQEHMKGPVSSLMQDIGETFRIRMLINRITDKILINRGQNNLIKHDHFFRLIRLYFLELREFFSFVVNVFEYGIIRSEAVPIS
jgi:hypothetical protein